MEEFVSEMTNELTSSGPIQGQSVYVWPTTRGDNFREKLEEEPQEDGSCSQATTVGGSTGAAVLGSADSGIKKRPTETQHVWIGHHCIANILDFLEHCMHDLY